MSPSLINSSKESTMSYQKEHVQSMDKLAKEGIKDLLRSGASMLRIKAQGARDNAEHQRTLAEVAEINSVADTPDQELGESLTELDEVRFRAVLLVDSMVVNLLIRQLAAEEGFKSSDKEEICLTKIKEMVKLIREGDKETVSGIKDKLISMHYVNREIFSFLGKEKFLAINEKARDIATTYSSDIYA